MPFIVDAYGEKRGSVRKLGNVIRKGASRGALLQTQEGVDETQGRRSGARHQQDEEISASRD